MNGKVQRPEIEYEWLADEIIEARALDLLAEYGAAVAPIIAPPVPVEEIVDCHLEPALRFDDLAALFGESALLGATDPEAKILYVSQALDPTDHPAMLGRGRFTIAHEVGHWRLHVPLLQIHAGQQSLFEAPTSRKILCRAGNGRRPREEVQADLFAGFLLMPKELVRAAWKERFGSLAALDVSAEVSRLPTAWNLGETQEPTASVARDLAARFEVSGQAMQIRLARLGLLNLDGQRELLPRR